MCGIAGVLGKGLPDSLEETIDRMLQKMNHRGPDGEGKWIESNELIGIGNKRLAIIDPEGGKQPLTNENSTMWIVFNGCIYNYQDLARHLKQKGHVFRTNCDTEVIIHAYEEWGVECVSHFNGMWAFAIWDERKKSLFCSRDRIGIKPFYYAWRKNTFVFASEIKAILASGLTIATPDQNAIRQYLTFQFCLEDATLFKGIQKLKPGHNLIIKKNGKPEMKCYWDISFEVDQKTDEKFFVDKLTSLLEDSVRLRLRADVPLGTHLSGGLDSSTIACLTRKLLGNAPIKTFTGTFKEDISFDESQYAKFVAKKIEADYFEISLKPSDFIKSIDKIIWFMDEPAAGPGVFPQYWVSKLASKQVKVVLGGQGGDELFIGYTRYLLAYLEECFKGAIQNTAHNAQYVATLETIVASLPSLEKYIPMLKSFWSNGLFNEPAQRYFRLIDRFPDYPKFLNRDYPINRDKTFEEFCSIFSGSNASAMINRILYFDIKNHLQSLLHVEDRTSMAWGLESRVPLLDHRLVELIITVPPVIKFKNGQLKYLFKKSAQNIIPKRILDRKDKMGFPVPLNKWFKSELSNFVKDILLDKQTRERNIFDKKLLEKVITSEQPFGRSVWGALCLELWHRQFIDGFKFHDS